MPENRATAPAICSRRAVSRAPIPATATLAVARIDCKRRPPADWRRRPEHIKRRQAAAAFVQPEADRQERRRFDGLTAASPVVATTRAPPRPSCPSRRAATGQPLLLRDSRRASRVRASTGPRSQSPATTGSDRGSTAGCAGGRKSVDICRLLDTDTTLNVRRTPFGLEDGQVGAAAALRSRIRITVTPLRVRRPPRTMRASSTSPSSRTEKSTLKSGDRTVTGATLVTG